MTTPGLKARRWVSLLAAGILLIVGSPVPAHATTALRGFDPGNIISDAAFFNPDAMSRDQVAAFISNAGAGCVSGPDGTPCLKDHISDIPERAATAHCGAVAAQGGASAADVIIASAQACGINPQVLLVLLQKEQALITGSGDRLYRDRYAKATGLGCPDFQACDPARATFFGQVYGAAERFKIYQAQPGNYRHRVGQVNEIAYHPEPLCGQALVTIKNQATAGLYNYTPYVPNSAALAAGAGEGDLCSAYGNRNFYRYMRQWFPATVSGSNAPAIAAAPASTVTPQMTAILRRAAEAGPALGSATGPIRCTGATCTKEYALAQITWTAATGAAIVGKLPRVAGQDRYATGVAVSQKAFPQGARTVFLATGRSFADALAVGPWAQKVSGSVLLTQPDRLAPAVRAELQRLRPTRIVVVGGTAAISAHVEDSARTAVPKATVDRVQGSTRYETALEIARLGFDTADEVYVASGRDFADALVGSAVSRGTGPIILLPGEATPTANVVDRIRRLAPTRIVLFGGTARLSEAAHRGLAAVAPVERIAGENRYHTAVIAAERTSSSPGRAIYVASGRDFPDALVSAGLQTVSPGPLLLSDRACLPAPVSTYLRSQSSPNVTLIGGTATLSGEVAALIPCR